MQDLQLMVFCEFLVDCIQPQNSSETQIKAGGLESVTITCARFNDNKTCRENVTTIMTRDKTICSDYSVPKCGMFLLLICVAAALNTPNCLFAFELEYNISGDLRTLKAIIKHPETSTNSTKRGRTFAFCSTNDAFLSYEIDWDQTGSFFPHAFLPFLHP